MATEITPRTSVIAVTARNSGKTINICNNINGDNNGSNNNGDGSSKALTATTTANINKNSCNSDNGSNVN